MWFEHYHFLTNLLMRSIIEMLGVFFSYQLGILHRGYYCILILYEPSKYLFPYFYLFFSLGFCGGGGGRWWCRI